MCVYKCNISFSCDCLYKSFSIQTDKDFMWMECKENLAKLFIKGPNKHRLALYPSVSIFWVTQWYNSYFNITYIMNITRRLRSINYKLS